MRTAVCLRRGAAGALALALGALVLAGQPLRAQPADAPVTQPARPVESFTGLPLPLLEDEQLVRLRDGCRVIVDRAVTAQQRDAISQQRWYGACRFGLVDGAGYFSTAAGASGGGDRFWPATMRLGGAVKPIRLPVTELNLFRGPPHDADLYYFDIKGTPEEASTAEIKKGGDPGGSDFARVFARNGRHAGVILAHFASKDASQEVSEMLWFVKRPCPSVVGRGDTTAKRLAQQTSPSLTQDSQNRLRAFCENAWARLQSEPASRNVQIPDFDNVDYGYYLAVYVDRKVKPIGPDGAPGRETSVDRATVCPGISHAGGCQAVWGPVLAGYIQARDAERKKAADQYARDDAERARQAAEREARFAPLEAAWRRKMIALTRDFAGKGPSPSAALSSPASARPAQPEATK